MDTSLPNDKILFKIDGRDNGNNEEYKIGSLVKINRFGERFWCEIIDVECGNLVLRVKNILINAHLTLGDYIFIEPEELVCRCVGK